MFLTLHWILMFSVVSSAQPSTTTQTEFRPIYSLSHDAGHDTLTCQGTLFYSSDDFKGEQARDVSVECKRDNKKRVCHVKYLGKKAKDFQTASDKTNMRRNFEFVMDHFSYFYLSLRKAKAQRVASQQADGSWKVKTEDGQSFQVTADQTKLILDKKSDTVVLSPEGRFSVIRSIQGKTPRAEFEINYEYNKVGETIYPKEIVAQMTSFAGVSETIDKLDMKFSSCSSK